jgi:leucyl/phenylalanyl-tRNA--protein transferase
VPVYRLNDTPSFPPPSEAESDGLLAVGGDLSPRRLLAAYSQGIFPWYDEGQPILWFSPDPRVVLYPGQVRRSRGLRRTLARTPVRLTADSAFEQVMRACADAPRPGQEGTWITEDMIDGYVRLHDLGFAHSVEAWIGDELVGGVYGVSLGAYFSGESMFHKVSGASLACLNALLEQLAAWDFELFDCQMETPHVMRLGAVRLPREWFLERLDAVLKRPTRKGPWRLEITPGSS